jgi:hypothetical protein
MRHVIRHAYTMAYSNAQLTALESAISSGILRVRYADRDVTYQSTADMIKLRNEMRSELGVAVPASAKSRIITFATGKGL